MSINLTNLLLSLAYAMADLAGGGVSGGCVLGTDLFVHQMPEDFTGDAVAVLRVYGGPAPETLRHVPVVSVQCMTSAMDASAGLSLAQRLYGALFDPDNTGSSSGGGVAGRPRQSWSVAAKRLSTSGAIESDPDVSGGWDIRLIDPTGGGPGMTGRNKDGRWEIPFNFDVRFSKP